MTAERKNRGRPHVPEITEAQQRALRELRDFIASRKYPPTMAELGDRLGVAAASAHQLVKQLERKGYVARDARKARSLSIVRDPEHRPEKLVPVPLVGTVAAGPAMLAEENHLGDVLIDQAIAGRGRCFALRINGDSMTGAGMKNGDVIIVRQQPVAESGEIVVALLEDAATVKRLWIQGDRIELRAEMAPNDSTELHDLPLLINVRCKRRDDTGDNPCVVIPTAGGKTPVMATICKDAAVRWNGRVLILAHVKELLEQTADKLRTVCPEVEFGIYSAGLKRRDTSHRVIVAGIQSVYRRACELDAFDLVLVDEAHMIPPEGDGMYRQFLSDAKIVNPELRVVGFTATPFRMKTGPICTSDGILNHVCFEVGVRELIRDGYLCPLITKAGINKADFGRLHVRAGEFVADEVEDLMDDEQLVESACEETVGYTADRRSVLIFASGVRHGGHIVDLLRSRHGIEAGFVTGETPTAERDATLARFKAGDLKCLVNVNVLTTGFDAPNIDCVALVRPTMSPGLYYQMCGRGFRLHPDKRNCLVLDFGGNVLRHGPVDQIKVVDRSQGSGGLAPAKECPECQSLIAAGYAICPDCGYAFPPPDRKKHEPKASEAGILSGQSTDTEYEVRDVYYSVHTKRDAPPDAPKTMRVDYRLGLSHWQSEFICFEHSGYAKQKAILWWRQRSHDPIPDTAQRAVEIADGGGIAFPETVSPTEVERIAANIARYEPDQIAVAMTENHWEQMYADERSDESDHYPDPGPIPETLLRVPGFIADVINERQLHRHRTRAGNRVGDGRHVDLLRYTAWLVEQRHKPKPEGETDPYAKQKDRARERNAAIALAGRDIGDLPAVVDHSRKAKAAGSFRYFCEAYFSLTFHLDWSPDHLKVIQKIEKAVIDGGLFALAMARGSGKSSLAEVACIWAVLNGHRDFVCLIGSDEGHACDMLDSIKTELDSNDLLLADYPEVCFPIQALDGISNRANGQLYQGKRTQIGWTAKEIVLPTIADSKASGAIIKVAGLTGRIRGMKFKRPDGKTVRPSLVVLDDPQTDESARSLSQCANREAILAGAVLGLAGPGKKISGIMPCTVIRPGDMADNILDRDKHPEWNGERTRMVYSFPANETLWQRYSEIRAEGFRNGDGGKAGTEFYRQNREAMDEGAEVTWRQRYNYDELSAIQHAMNLKLQDEAAFFAEYQNEPLPEESVDEGQLTADQVAAKVNGMQRQTLPISANHLTAFIDVQQKLLFYVVAAWEDDFTGYVVDYGTYPDQRRAYFTLRDARQTLTTAAEGTGLEGSIYAGLESLTESLLAREWNRDDGAAMKIGRCLIDANWGHSTNVVYQFCRQSQHSAILLPSHGRFVGASSNPFSEYKRRPGDRVGLNWRIPSIHGKRAIRHVIYDTNWWKSFTHARLAVAMGDRGCLSIFGDRAETHRLFAEQVTAEYFVKTEGRGRTVDEWKARPEQSDNHWLDCLVGCAVGASMQGAVLFGTDGGGAVRHKHRVSFKELQRRKRS